MSGLPPELAQLDEQYVQLTNAVDAGHITVANAMASLDAMIVVDPAGGVWRIDADGDFTRAPAHGAPPVKTDPSAWPVPYAADPAASLSPYASGPAMPPQQPNPGLFTPPTMPAQQPAFNPMGAPPQASPVGAPSWATGLDSASMGYDTGGFEEAKHIGGGEPPTKKSKRSKEPRAPRSGGGLPGPLAWADEHKKMLIIGVFAVVLIAVAFISTRGSSEEGSSLPAPAASTDTFVTDDQSAAPSQSQEPTDPVESAPPAQQGTALPTAEDLSSVISILRSGSPEGAVVNADDRAALGAATVVLTGAQQLGYEVQGADPKKGKGGKITQSISVVDAEGVPLLKASVVWKSVDGTWKLAFPPAFS